MPPYYEYNTDYHRPLNWDDPVKMAAKIKEKPSLYRGASDRVKNMPHIAELAVRSWSYNYHYLPEAMKSRELSLFACSDCADNIRSIPLKFKDDEEFIITVISNDAAGAINGYKGASRRLQRQRNIIEMAIGKDNSVMGLVPKDILIKSPELVFMAIRTNSSLPSGAIVENTPVEFFLTKQNVIGLVDDIVNVFPYQPHAARLILSKIPVNMRNDYNVIMKIFELVDDNNLGVYELKGLIEEIDAKMLNNINFAVSMIKRDLRYAKLLPKKVINNPQFLETYARLTVFN